jgi:hypothetical protein
MIYQARKSDDGNCNISTNSFNLESDEDCKYIRHVGAFRYNDHTSQNSNPSEVRIESPIGIVS